MAPMPGTHNGFVLTGYGLKIGRILIARQHKPRAVIALKTNSS
jgi:hypothetical protein